MSLPDPREQSRIAAVLDTVDEAIATTEAVIAKLKQMRAGLLHDVFTCGLDEHGRLRDPIAHPEQFQDSPLGRIPREWARRALRDCLVDNPQNGIYKPAGAIGHGTLLIGQTSITDERSIDVNLARRAEVTIQERGRYELETDDILVSRVFATLAGVGQPALVPEFREPAVYESNMMRLRTRRAVVAPSLLFHWLRTARIRALLLSGVNLSNQASVNQQALNGLPVIVPPVREQERMLVAICASDELAQATSSELGKLVQLRSGLMTDLLSGRVRVPETLFPVETSA